MIQAFATQQGPQLAVLLTTVGLIEDLEFVVYREAVPGGFDHHFRIGWRRTGAGGSRNQHRRSAGPFGSLGLTFEPGTTETCFLLDERLFMF